MTNDRVRLNFTLFTINSVYSEDATSSVTYYLHLSAMNQVFTMQKQYEHTLQLLTWCTWGARRLNQLHALQNRTVFPRRAPAGDALARYPIILYFCTTSEGTRGLVAPLYYSVTYDVINHSLSAINCWIRASPNFSRDLLLELFGSHNVSVRPE